MLVYYLKGKLPYDRVGSAPYFGSQFAASIPGRSDIQSKPKTALNRIDPFKIALPSSWYDWNAVQKDIE